MNYTHITQEERYQIYALKKAGFSQSKISETIGRSPSTISRELKRNQGLRGYRPHPVSYTHLDVYKRQMVNSGSFFGRRFFARGSIRLGLCGNFSVAIQAVTVAIMMLT